MPFSPSSSKRNTMQSSVFNINSSTYHLTSLRYWDVRMPPVKKHMVGGRLLPTIKGTISPSRFTSKKRRITIEVYSEVPNNAKRRSPKAGFQELLRGISSSDFENPDNNSYDADIELTATDLVAFRVLKPKRKRKQPKHNDDDNGDWESHSISNWSASSLGDSSDEDDDDDLNQKDRNTVHWVERFRCFLDTIELMSSSSSNTKNNRSCDLKVGSGMETKIRSFYFESQHDSKVFVSVLQKMQTKQRERAARMATAYISEHLSNRIEPSSSSINLLIEIVSARNLPVADVFSSDPYCLVREGDRELHRTETIDNTLNPVWTLTKGSLFLWQTTAAEIFQRSNFVSFQIKDKDQIGRDEILGRADISKKEILAGTGERVELELVEASDRKTGVRFKKGQKKPFLVLRFRHATENDIDFMETFKECRRRQRSAVYADEVFFPPRTHRIRGLNRKGGGPNVQYRTRPLPDPQRKLETTWMASKEFDSESMKPSREWIESGSGTLGKVYVEVLCCDDLPNMDLTITGRNKTDSFVCMVFEDCVVNTDVISDCLSPRWMPWSQRAFVFNIIHPTSQIMVCVCDHDTMSSDDPVGRAVVSLSNLRPDTVYTMKYNLIDIRKGTRQERGTITLRVRIEFPSERLALLAGMNFTKTHHNVSVAKKNDFSNTFYALANERAPHVLSLTSITRYIEELESYQETLILLGDAILTVILWRGHFPFTFRVPFLSATRNQENTEGMGCLDRYTKRVTIKLPIHSITAFAWGNLLAYDFQYFFSFIAFLPGWILLATLEQAQVNPSQWNKPRSYIELLSAFMFNKTLNRPQIKMNENIAEINVYNEAKTAREKAFTEMMKKAEAEREKYEKILEKEGTDLLFADMGAKAGSSISEYTLAPFKRILLPAQMEIHRICVLLRVVRSILIWRESSVAFCIVTTSFLACALLALIPWAILIRWSFTIVVWVFLGPWMKIVDICYFRNRQGLDLQQDQIDFLLGESERIKLQKEKAIKKKDIKRYMFGQYLMRVPVFKEERYYDDPLPASMAEPYNRDKAGSINIVKTYGGQALSGDMIPTRGASLEHEEAELEADAIPIESAPLLAEREEDLYGTLV